MDAPEEGMTVVIVTRRGASPDPPPAPVFWWHLALTPQATSRIEWSHRCGGAVDELLTARSGHTSRVALLVAYDTSVVAGQQVPRRSACWNSRVVMEHADVADSSWRSTW